MSWDDIPPEAYGVIGALVGALIGFSGSVLAIVLTPRAQRALEEAKLRSARQDAMHKELLVRIQTLTADLASAAHSICWLSWAAGHGTLTKKMITEYDRELHLILPKIIGGVGAVASLDEELAQTAKKLHDEIVGLDANIGAVTAGSGTDLKTVAEELKDVHPGAYVFATETLYELGDAARAKTNKLLEASFF